MNRKIQETDREFILARYRRDKHAFDARAEAQTYKVSLRTIYNVIARAGLKMKRGRKPFVAPVPPPSLKPLKSIESRDTAELLVDLLDAIDPLDSSDVPEILIPPIPQDFPRPHLEIGSVRKGPPAIHPPKPPSPGSPEYRPNKMPG